MALLKPHQHNAQNAYSPSLRSLSVTCFRAVKFWVTVSNKMVSCTEGFATLFLSRYPVVFAFAIICFVDSFWSFGQMGHRRESSVSPSVQYETQFFAIVSLAWCDSCSDFLPVPAWLFWWCRFDAECFFLGEKYQAKLCFIFPLFFPLLFPFRNPSKSKLHDSIYT